MQVPERHPKNKFDKLTPLLRNLDSSQSGRKCGATAELGKSGLLHIQTAQLL